MEDFYSGAFKFASGSGAGYSRLRERIIAKVSCLRG